MDNKELLKPIQPDEIEWRVQSTTKDKSKTIIVPYITNRCVMDRFDNAFGWDGWKSEFKDTEEGYICRITVHNGVYKEDGASRTKIEAVKGGVSDSMKRCAVQFGLGRDLYNYPKVMLKGDVKYISDKTLKELNDLTQDINNDLVSDKFIMLDSYQSKAPVKKVETEPSPLLKWTEVAYNNAIDKSKSLSEVLEHYELNEDKQLKYSNAIDFKNSGATEQDIY